MFPDQLRYFNCDKPRASETQSRHEHTPIEQDAHISLVQFNVLFNSLAPGILTSICWRAYLLAHLHTCTLAHLHTCTLAHLEVPLERTVRSRALVLCPRSDYIGSYRLDITHENIRETSITATFYLSL
jgi:hypothetical protein